MIVTLREFVIGVFEHPRKSGRVSLMAYSRDYNPKWEGCCVHRVLASTGTEAKAAAMVQHRRECMAACESAIEAAAVPR